MSLPTPPLTPTTRVAMSPHRYRPAHSSPLAMPTDFALPPPLEVPELEMPAPSLESPECATAPEDTPQETPAEMVWRPGMSRQERDARDAWLAGARGRKGLRIVIVTENFLPKVDGVTRTLARLLEHLEREGHQCMLLGPGTGMSHYASHPLVGTAGVPLVVYPGLKLNFLRPKFLRTIQDFQPDVVHFVDPIWLGAQTLMAMELGWAGGDWVGNGGPAIGTGISGAVVASYHTNLATYATLFGMSWLEPIMWRLQQWLYSKTLLTLCPSPSTKAMLESQSFADVRLWPRGVDLSQFGPSKRSAAMRALWGVGEPEPVPVATVMAEKKAPIPANNMSMPLTPPPSPVVLAAGATGATPGSVPESTDAALPSRVVLLYVGRVSWEKNLVLLLRAYGRMGAFLPAGTPLPKLVFVGDGPARTELESICEQEGYDATFMGHRSGEELAACYASADVFAFPSFTETFGQVVLEALASGLPVIGLDAQGTRDLVSHGSTGLLLPLPKGKDGTSTWPAVCCPSHTLFPATVEVYAALLARVASNPAERAGMGGRACTDGIRGFTWWDAMERCVDGYREAVGRARSTRAAAHAERLEAELAAASSGSEGSARTAAPSSSPRISRVNRALSARLAKRPDAAAFQLTPSKSTLTSASHRRRGGSSARKSYDPAETLWHLKNVAKVVLVAIVFWAIFARHLESKGRVMGWAEVWFRPKLEASSS